MAKYKAKKECFTTYINHQGEIFNVVNKLHIKYKKRGCLKIELRWPLLFYFKLKSFGFFSKKEAYKLTFSIQTVFYWYKPPKRLFLQDYVQ